MGKEILYQGQGDLSFYIPLLQRDAPFGGLKERMFDQWQAVEPRKQQMWGLDSTTARHYKYSIRKGVVIDTVFQGTRD